MLPGWAQLLWQEDAHHHHHRGAPFSSLTCTPPSLTPYAHGPWANPPSNLDGLLHFGDNDAHLPRSAGCSDWNERHICHQLEHCSGSKAKKKKTADKARSSCRLGGVSMWAACSMLLSGCCQCSAVGSTQADPALVPLLLVVYALAGPVQYYRRSLVTCPVVLRMSSFFLT